MEASTNCHMHTRAPGGWPFRLSSTCSSYMLSMTFHHKIVVIPQNGFIESTCELNHNILTQTNIQLYCLVSIMGVVPSDFLRFRGSNVTSNHLLPLLPLFSSLLFPHTVTCQVDSPFKGCAPLFQSDAPVGDL